MQSPERAPIGCALTFTRVGVSFALRDGGEHHVLGGLDLTVAPGEFVGIVGPSGSGKSTIFNCIAGLLAPTRGTVALDGVAVRGPSTDVAYMLQKDLLLPWRTALDNVTLGLELRGRTRRDARAIARTYFARYGLAGREDALPRQLSGGMRQRVALIRTLVVEPRLVMLDEPFSALDYQTRTLLQTDVARIVRETGCTTILVTHDIEEAVALCDRVVVLGGTPARVVAEHVVALTLAGPRTPLSAREAPEFGPLHRRIWAELAPAESAA
jgi:NitT/TauT family transport system ATP-binding protein